MRLEGLGDKLVLFCLLSKKERCRIRFMDKEEVVKRSLFLAFFWFTMLLTLGLDLWDYKREYGLVKITGSDFASAGIVAIVGFITWIGSPWVMERVLKKEKYSPFGWAMVINGIVYANFLANIACGVFWLGLYLLRDATVLASYGYMLVSLLVAFYFMNRHKSWIERNWPEASVTIRI